jgi:hypothetical protein
VFIKMQEECRLSRFYISASDTHSVEENDFVPPPSMNEHLKYNAQAHHAVNNCLINNKEGIEGFGRRKMIKEALF